VRWAGPKTNSPLPQKATADCHGLNRAAFSAMRLPARVTLDLVLHQPPMPRPLVKHGSVRTIA